LFSRHGYEATSVQAVADEVGVSKQTLLYHFSSKEGLREAVLKEMVEVWRNVLPRLLTALTKQEAPFEEALAEVLAFFRAEPAYARFLMQELLQRVHGQHPIVADIEPWLKVGVEFLRHAQGERKVDLAVDPEAWLVNVGTLLLATLSLLDEDRPGPTSDRIVREMARIMGSSLVRRDAASPAMSLQADVDASPPVRLSGRSHRRG
jgi:TetR/AcrR family transcriptional regulator